jgi:hypothetical protein
MHTSSKPESGTAHSYVHTPTRTVEVNGSPTASSARIPEHR